MGDFGYNQNFLRWPGKVRKELYFIQFTIWTPLNHAINCDWVLPTTSYPRGEKFVKIRLQLESNPGHWNSRRVRNPLSQGPSNNTWWKILLRLRQKWWRCCIKQRWHSFFLTQRSQVWLPKKYFDVAQIYQRHWLEESGQRLTNVNQTHLVQQKDHSSTRKESRKTLPTTIHAWNVAHTVYFHT